MIEIASVLIGVVIVAVLAGLARMVAVAAYANQRL